MGGQTAKNLHKLVRKFELDQGERKSLQVNASACKVWPNGVVSIDQSFQLASTSTPFGHGFISFSQVDPFPLLRANRKQTNLSNIQANLSNIPAG